MPRITIETKHRVMETKHGMNSQIYEIKTSTYDLPDTIVYKNTVLSYDSYHQVYVDKTSQIWISPIQYVEMVLAKEETKQQENQL